MDSLNTTNKHVPCWVLWVAKTSRPRDLSFSHSAQPCSGLPKKASQFPCLWAYLYFQPSLFWVYRNYSLEVDIFVPVPFMCHPWACFPFSLACSLQPLSWKLLPWTTLAASAVGVLPSGLVSSFSVCCQEPLQQPRQPLFLHVLPGATVKSK